MKYPHVELGERYARDVVAGKILACKWVKLACNRHIEDRKRKDWPYKFEPAIAERKAKFIELFPHTKGKWAAKNDPFILAPWQCFMVLSIFGWVHREGPKKGKRRFTRAMLLVPRKNGKALDIVTPIPTPDGFKRIGDLGIGDEVFGVDGSVRRVIAATDTMLGRPCYRIEFTDGASIIADADHEWVTDSRIERERRHESTPSTKTTSEIAATLFCRDELNHRISLPSAFNCAPKDLPIDPYVLGVWLGDGNSANARVTIGAQDSVELCSLLQERGQSVLVGRGERTKNSYLLGDGDRRQAARNISIQAQLRNLGVLNNKHIPDVYLFGSESQRWALLRGLMDTDGYVSVAGQCEFTTTNAAIACGAETLLWGLGFKPTTTEGIASLYGRKIGPKWRIQFWSFADRPAFRLSRKIERLKTRPPKQTRSSTRQIVRCEPVKSVPVRCIQVDHEDGMYLAGDTFIPTHNSDLAARIGLAMFADDEEFGAEVYSGATSEVQAWEVFRPARLMAERTPAFTDFYGVGVMKSNLHILVNGSRFEPIIGKPGDGASPSCAIIDEYHEHLDDTLFDTMETGMAAREQPLSLVITTAGDNLGGPCYSLLKDLEKILEGTTENESFWGIEYSIDEKDAWDSEAALRKANPNYGVSVDVDRLKVKQQEAIRNSRKQGVFQTKHLNVWVGARQAFFNMHAWHACAKPGITPELYKGHRCLVGLDLASTKDIAAVVMLFCLPGGRYAGFWRFYIPEAAIENGANEHYAGWARDGRLIVAGDEMISYPRIEADVLEIHREYGISELAFDPAYAQMMVQRLGEQGITCVEVRPTVMNFSGPMKHLDGLILSSLFEHDGDPCMAWQMSNVVSKTDQKDNVYPNKERPEAKIDGPVALMMAMNRGMVEVEEKEYEVFFV